MASEDKTNQPKHQKRRNKDVCWSRCLTLWYSLYIWNSDLSAVSAKNPIYFSLNNIPTCNHGFYQCDFLVTLFAGTTEKCQCLLFNLSYLISTRFFFFFPLLIFFFRLENGVYDDGCLNWSILALYFSFFLSLLNFFSPQKYEDHFLNLIKYICRKNLLTLRCLQQLLWKTGLIS